MKDIRIFLRVILKTIILNKNLVEKADLNEKKTILC